VNGIGIGIGEKLSDPDRYGPDFTRFRREGTEAPTAAALCKDEDDTKTLEREDWR
jgi:hypothetical protein